MNHSMSRAQVAAGREAHFTKKFGAKVWARFDEAKRKYLVRGEGLPAADELRSRYPNGWSLLDYFTPRRARAIIAQ